LGRKDRLKELTILPYQLAQNMTQMEQMEWLKEVKTVRPNGSHLSSIRRPRIISFRFDLHLKDVDKGKMGREKKDLQFEVFLDFRN
jgi:hypothetical protein